jgi:dTDP-4-dehydrorhamnose reductase
MVLGAASWLGYLLLHRMDNAGQFILYGSLYKSSPDFPSGITTFQASSTKDYQEALLQNKPNIIVNFLRGEDDTGIDIHSAVIDYCKGNNSHYIYASSALALDAYDEIDLTESLKGKSITTYGNFKAVCEKMIEENHIKYSILRFGSVHGFTSHKTTRSEYFLKRLKSGETINVDRGIFQSRMIADELVKNIELIISRSLEGVFHFGASDSSEEYNFLKRLAKIFHYSEHQINGGNLRDVDIVLCTRNTRVRLPESNCLSEEDTLIFLKNHPQLQKYFAGDKTE